jgi:hypothetical protein
MNFLRPKAEWKKMRLACNKEVACKEEVLVCWKKEEG